MIQVLRSLAAEILSILIILGTNVVFFLSKMRSIISQKASGAPKLAAVSWILRPVLPKT